MKKFLILILLCTSLLTAAPHASAAIAYVGGTSGETSGTTDIITLTYTTTAGTTLVVTTESRFVGQTVLSVVEGAGNNLVHRASYGSDQINVEVWSTAAGGAVGDTTVTVTFSDSTSNRKGAQLAEYTGVGGIGTSATNNGNSATPSVAITTQDANNYVVAGHQIASDNSLTATAGTVRQTSNAGTDLSGILIDNTAASASSINTASTNATSALWGAVALELIVTPPPPELPAGPAKFKFFGGIFRFFGGSFRFR